MMRKSNYRIERETDFTVELIDLGPHDIYLTITNDAENIISDLEYEQRCKVITYKDTDGFICQILTDGTKFTGIKIKDW